MQPFGFTQGRELVEWPFGFAQGREHVERQLDFLRSHQCLWEDSGETSLGSMLLFPHPMDPHHDGLLADDERVG